MKCKELTRRFAPAAVACGAGVAAILPAAARGFPYGNDLPHHYRMSLAFYDSIRAGNLYPGLIASTNGGFGDFSPRLYPPLVYYLLAAGRGVAGDWYAGSFLVFSLLSAAGCLGIYFWARAFLAPRHAALAGALYAFVPFRLDDFYQGSYFGQYAAGAVLPFAFAFVERVCRRGTRRDVAGLAASFALLCLTHLPLTVIGSLSLLVYALLRLPHGARLTAALRLAGGVLLGLLCSSFYWATMLAERSWVRIGFEQPGRWADYSRNFLFQREVYPETVWVLFVNVVAVATFAMFLPALALARRWREVGPKSEVKALAALLLLSTFFATPLSRPVWAVLPSLQQTQFPWRWLAVASMAGPPLVAASVPVWAEQLKGYGRALSLAVACVMLALVASASSFVVTQADYYSRAEFDAKLVTLPDSATLSDWLPAWAKTVPPKADAPLRIPQRTFTIRTWEPERRAFRVAAGQAVEARVCAFYYPRWVAVDERGGILPTRPDEDGALLVSLPAEEVSVELNFREPRLAKLSGAASAAGWVLLFALCVSGRRREPPSAV